MGDTRHPFVALGKKMALPQTAVLSIEGPHAVHELVPEAKSCWFKTIDEKGEGLDIRKQMHGLQTTAALLCTLIETMTGPKYGWEPQNIFLLGFSQGALVALWATLAYPIRLGGVICVRDLLPNIIVTLDEKKRPQQLRKQKAAPTPLLYLVGRNDERIPQKLAESHFYYLRDSFKNSHPTMSDVFMHVSDAKHEMIASEEEMREVMSFLSERMHRRLIALEDNPEFIEVAPGDVVQES
eukprot:TRINITY_DN28262_c0_g1_i1.p1 TRINITY_DN28262_c0_g1~~TRINITY_DN28262_c0_g1_i1.p1  ORF type:complete len:275 (+),score=46.36 TRINITY_DN28262_c0_g1_i1:109-825(+)